MENPVVLIAVLVAFYAGLELGSGIAKLAEQHRSIREKQPKV